MAYHGFSDLYALSGYRLQDGYAALTPAGTLNYHSPQALRVAQVEYISAEFQQVAHIPGAERLAGGWFRIPDPLPRARLVTEARVSRQPGVDLPLVDVERVALTTHALALTAGAPGTVEIVQDDPGEIRLETGVTGRQLLVVSEAFDEGWTAAVDGEPAPVERVNGDFIACVVPARGQRVAFEFRPTHLRLGRAISLGGLALALVLAGAAIGPPTLVDLVRLRLRYGGRSA